MKLERAVKFLENVTNKIEVVPMRRYAGSTGRCAQGEWLSFPVGSEVGKWAGVWFLGLGDLQHGEKLGLKREKEKELWGG